MAGTDRARPYDGQLLLALLAGATQDEAARHCGISARTVRRRLADPTFRHRFELEQADYVRRMRRRLVAVGETAMTTLNEVSRNVGGAADAGNASVRVRAARALLAGFLRAWPVPQQIELDGTVGIAPDMRRSALERLREAIEGAQPKHDAVPSGNGTNGRT